MSDCIFCKIVSGEIPADLIYTDDKIIVFNDIRPKAKVHLLVVSKEHIDNMFEFNENHSGLITHMILALGKMAKKLGLESGFRTIINTGSGGGQEVNHVHFHLLGGGMLPKF